MAQVSKSNYLERFFKEKGLAYKSFEIEHEGQIHYLDNEMIIDIIKNQTAANEQKSIEDVIRRIDIQNGDVNHFLEHLATGFVRNNY